MHARLTIISGARTQHVDLRLPTVMGRGNAAKLKLPSSTVSRQHCEVYEYDGQIAIRDLESSNGTVVNGHRIEGPTFITPEDEVAVGPICFRLKVVAPEAVEKQPSPEPTSTDLDELGHIPTSSTSPKQAESAAEDQQSLAHTDEAPSTEEGSRLKYVEAEDEGERSFVGIVTDEPSPDEVTSSPDIATDSESRESVASDDSSLQNFFENLDG